MARTHFTPVGGGGGWLGLGLQGCPLLLEEEAAEEEEADLLGRWRLGRGGHEELQEAVWE